MCGRYDMNEQVERQQDSDRASSISSLRYRGNRTPFDISTGPALTSHSRPNSVSQSRRHSSADEDYLSNDFTLNMLSKFAIGPDGLIFMPESDEELDSRNIAAIIEEFERTNILANDTAAASTNTPLMDVNQVSQSLIH